MECIKYLKLTFDYKYVPVTLTDEIHEWLRSHDSDGEYTLGGFGVFFTKDEDAVFFKLKFS